MKRMRWMLISLGLIGIMGCGAGTDTTGDASVATDTAGASEALATEDTFTVELECTDEGWYIKDCKDEDGSPKPCCVDETIEIPNGRPAYALLVSGFHQNRNLDMFHYYDFAKCLQEKGVYVHYAWWNNLLAPRMARPLHNDDSIPSTSIIPWHDMNGFIFGWQGKEYPNKAIPAEDNQFQMDAKALLRAIRENNPHAAIILVGHSMGGDAVVRLADSMPDDFDIDLLAPIDPVGNRTCMPYDPPAGNYSPYCRGWDSFKRFYAVRNDWFWLPSHRRLGANINYLYHRWQTEFNPPFDYGSWEYFSHSGTSDQEWIMTNRFSGLDVPPPDGPNYLGGLDGHGEIVGFRGAELNGESYPLGLKAQGEWPYWLPPGSRPPGYDVDEMTEQRVGHMEEWDANPYYLDEYHGLPGGPPVPFAPRNPEFCMVSEDLCEIFHTAVALPPSADAGPDQAVECSGPDGAEATLDGSGSSDPNGDPLTFTWTGPFGTVTGEMVAVYLPVGTHTITLTVEDETGKSDSDTVSVTVTDSTPPSLSVSLSPDVLWPPNHEMVSISASVQASDICDASPLVELTSIVSSEADNGPGDGNTNDDIQGAKFGTDDRTFSLRAERVGTGVGRVYTVTYKAIDDAGNTAEEYAEATAPHDQGSRVP